MAENGATINLDIERARTDNEYWSDQLESNNIPKQYILDGVVPYGYSGKGVGTAKYLKDGPNEPTRVYASTSSETGNPTKSTKVSPTFNNSPGGVAEIADDAFRALGSPSSKAITG